MCSVSTEIVLLASEIRRGRVRNLSYKYHSERARLLCRTSCESLLLIGHEVKQDVSPKHIVATPIYKVKKILMVPF
jgi:hypothetical protein